MAGPHRVSCQNQHCSHWHLPFGIACSYGQFASPSVSALEHDTWSLKWFELICSLPSESTDAFV